MARAFTSDRQKLNAEPVTFEDMKMHMPYRVSEGALSSFNGTMVAKVECAGDPRFALLNLSAGDLIEVLLHKSSDRFIPVKGTYGVTFSSEDA